MSRRGFVIGLVAVLLLAGLLVVYLNRRGDDGPTSGERATCYAVRDLEADLLDENATVEDVWPRVAAVVRAAHRTENETLVARARETQRRWRIYADSERQTAYDAFLRVYIRLAEHCGDLGVTIYSDE